MILYTAVGYHYNMRQIGAEKISWQVEDAFLREFLFNIFMHFACGNMD